MNNSIWQILAIPPTADERAIKRAYAKQLKTLDPDDRDAFIALREAYENALDWAGWQNEDGDAPPFAESGAAQTPYPPDADTDRDALYAQAPESGDDGYAYDDYEEYDGYGDYGDDEEYDGGYDDEYADDGYDDDGYGTEDGFSDDFVAQSWESWQVSESEEDLLERLTEQHNTLQEKDISTSIAYTDALLHWFYHSENHAPRAFAWAAGAYRWTPQAGNWHLQELLERYPESQYPEFDQYPALMRWDDRWHQGFWARFVQFVHPIERARVGEELARYWRDRRGNGELPPSFHSLADNKRLYWLAWLMYVPVVVLYSSDYAGLGGHLLAMMLLFSGAFLWGVMVAKSWRQSAPRTEWSMTKLFCSLAFLLFWCIAWLELEKPSDSQSVVGVNTMLSVSGAAFAACFLRRTALPPAMRGHFTSSLLYGALLLPFFAFMLENQQIAKNATLYLWLLGGYAVLSAYGIVMMPVYRRWDYILASVAAIALFLLFVFGVLPSAALLAIQLGLWLVMPFAIQLAPRLPTASYLLSDTLRVFGQCVLVLCVPVFLWQSGRYPAFAASLAVLSYIIWIDSEIDDEYVAAARR